MLVEVPVYVSYINGTSQWKVVSLPHVPYRYWFAVEFIFYSNKLRS